jgi:hypothetical protein
MKNALLILIAAALAFSCNDKKEVKPEVPKSNDIKLAGYFKMDGDASDSTGKVEALATDVTFGPKTAFFNGTSSFIQIPSAGSFAPADQLTLSLFFKATYDAALEPRLLQMTDENGNAIELFIKNSRVLLTHWDEAQKKDIVRIMTPTAPNLNAWNKVVATIDFANNSMSLYVNDDLVQTVSNVTLAKLGKSTMILGRHQHLGGEPKDFYYGELDNVRIDPTIVDQSLFPQFGQ